MKLMLQYNIFLLFTGESDQLIDSIDSVFAAIIKPKDVVQFFF